MADRKAQGQIVSAFSAAFEDMLRTFGVERTSAIVASLGIVKPHGRPPKDPGGDKRLAADYAGMPARKKKTMGLDRSTTRRVQRQIAQQAPKPELIMPEFSPIADDLDARTRAAITMLRTALVAQLNGLTKEEWKESTRNPSSRPRGSLIL